MQSLFSIQGKVAVITGGTGVLGRAIAEGLAEAGAKVVVIGRNQEKLASVTQKIVANGGEAVGFSCDVLSKDALEKACDQVSAKYGTLDILINGAGGNRPAASTSSELSFFDLDQAALDEVMQLNFMGTLLPTQVFGKLFVEKKHGVVLNISSMASFRPLTNVLGYAAAKAAVNNFTQWLAVHMNLNYSPNIRVNAIAPGFFLTEQNNYLMIQENGELTPRAKTILGHTPMDRFGEPDDLIGTVLWLISDASRFVTGQVVAIDGGFSAFTGV